MIGMLMTEYNIVHSMYAFGYKYNCVVTLYQKPITTTKLTSAVAPPAEFNIACTKKASDECQGKKCYFFYSFEW